MGKLICITFLLIVINLASAVEKVKLVCKDKSKHCSSADTNDGLCEGVLTKLLCRKTCGMCECKDSGHFLCNYKDTCNSPEGKLLCEKSCNSCEFEVLPSASQNNNEDELKPSDDAEDTPPPSNPSPDQPEEKPEEGYPGSSPTEKPSDGGSPSNSTEPTNDKEPDNIDSQLDASKTNSTFNQQNPAEETKKPGEQNPAEETKKPAEEAPPKPEEKPEEKAKGEKAAPDGSINEECLTAHNEKRAKHQNTSPLVWDKALQKSAEDWANKLAKEGNMVHSQGKTGENLYMNSQKEMEKACARATEEWYKEIKDYEFSNPGFQGRGGKPVGHFTQVVWKGTSKLGCGIGRSNFGVYVVCQYLDAGNFMSKFAENVSSPTK